MTATRSFNLAVATLGLFFAGIVTAQDAPMTSEEIKAGWVGKKIVSRGANGALFDLFFKADGTIEISGNSFSDSGVWRLAEQGYCATWKKIRAGEERCFTVAKRGFNLQVFNPDGSVSGTILKVE
jgi:uncharacterized membrane protein